MKSLWGVVGRSVHARPRPKKCKYLECLVYPPSERLRVAYANTDKEGEILCHCTGVRTPLWHSILFCESATQDALQGHSHEPANMEH